MSIDIHSILDSHWDLSFKLDLDYDFVFLPMFSMCDLNWIKIQNIYIYLAYVTDSNIK